MGFYQWRFRISHEAARAEAARREGEQPRAKMPAERNPVWVHRQQSAAAPASTVANEDVTIPLPKPVRAMVRA
jgi:hypothetical protein